MLKDVPGWLVDRNGPLVVRPSYFLHAMPWLLRFIAAGRADRIPHIVDALHALHSPVFDSYMPLLQAAREVIVVTVTDDKEFRRGQSGVELCRHLGRHGVKAAFEAVERRERDVASVLREAGGDYAIDLLVMGGYAHSTLRGLIFGSATRGIFERPLTRPILMAH